MTQDLWKPGVIKSIMQARGLRFNRSLGQNFLIEPRVLEAIYEAAALEPDDLILEIGPGLGTLTQGLCRRAGRVVAVELDRSLAALLPENLGHPDNLEVFQGDATEIDLAGILAQRLRPGARAKAVANLPYYVTTPILMRLLEEGLPLQRIVVMVQKEVADRMTAGPGGKDYGALTLAVRYYSVARIVTRVPRGAFLPPPDVDSAVVRLDVRAEPPVPSDPRTLFSVIRAAFGQRRKQLGNTIASGLGLSKDAVADILEGMGIDPRRRGETLSLEEFAGIADALKRHLVS